MTIKEVESRTGLARSNIRFYEKEKLILPARNDSNGYREYTEQNVQDIKKIAYLRTLGISIENIHKVINREVPLHEVIETQAQSLDEQIVDLQKAKSICQSMLAEKKVSYEELDVEAYVPELPAYWKSNQRLFKLDSVGFLYLWSGFMAWGLMAAACLAVALLAYPSLPDEIAVQWSDGEASSTVSKIFIFAYPIACIIIRLWFRPYFRSRLRIENAFYNDLISDYLTNFLCFAALSVEVFSILFMFGIVKHVTTLLLLDVIVLIGLLIIGVRKLYRFGDE